MWLRIIIFVVIIALIIYGVRSIKRNINDYFSDADKEKLKRDRADRDRAEIVDLKRDPKDGIFRPGGDKKDKDQDT
ncbi:hypothetical protein [Maritalea sp.]|uniref:hypothetical protein n=1 Tax=Maritalea sp. TaxID=2003361 RepID=UPI003EF4B6BB